MQASDLRSSLNSADEIKTSDPATCGRFRPGYDPRRHYFTREECQRGYRAAMESLERRFPGCDAHFLMCAIIGSRPWHTLPEIRQLLERDEPPDDEEACALFARE